MSRSVTLIVPNPLKGRGYIFLKSVTLWIISSRVTGLFPEATTNLNLFSSILGGVIKRSGFWFTTLVMPLTSGIISLYLDSCFANIVQLFFSPSSVIDPYINNPSIQPVISVHQTPAGVAIDPKTEKVYVADTFSGTVSVMDSRTDTVNNIIPVGKYPFGVAIDPNTDKVYVTNRDSNTVSVIDSTKDKVATTMWFSISPSVDSGHIKCDNKDVATNQHLLLESYTKCTAYANNGFQFNSWTQNLGHNSTKTISTSTLAKSPIDTLLSSLGFLPTDSGAVFSVTQFGNFTANFKQVPPPIPPEYWIPLYGVIVSSLVGWSIPSIIGCVKAKKQGGRADRYYQRINWLYKDGKLDENDIADLDRLKTNLTFAYAKGKISEQHYTNLKNEISVLFEEIYKKKTDSLNGNGILLDKVKDDIKDAYAKGKISEQHYKLLIEKISDIKNNHQYNKQNSLSTATTQGSPIKG